MDVVYSGARGADAPCGADVGVLALLTGHHDLGGRDRPVQGLSLFGGERVVPPRPRRRGRVGRPPGTIGLVERRDRLVDAEIRGVSHHCRIVTYRNAAQAALG
jgi:hypothetical protein